MRIDLKKGQKVWFTSDTHYNHGNICRPTSKWDDKSSTRDFKSLEAMNDELVYQINSQIGKDDYLFHLGDFSFGGPEFVKQFRSRINCKNVHLILGNHDWRINENDENTQDLFSSVNEYLFLTVFQHTGDETVKHRFVLCHYPIASWNGMCHGVIHLHGHVHLPKHLRLHEGMSMDVGVDGNSWSPISMEEVLKIMEGQNPCRPLTLPSKW